MYLEIAPIAPAESDAGAAELRACNRAAAGALRAAAGKVLRERDRVVAGPGARWFAALLVDRAVSARRRADVNDADLAAAAARLRVAVQSAIERTRADLAIRDRIAVRAGWTVIEPRDARSPLAELRHALRGAAVVARIEERRAVMLAAIAHELRTPLTAIVGFAERLADDPQPPRPRRRRALAIIRDESQRLSRLVDGLVDAGSWQAGALHLRLVRGSLRSVAERAAHAVAEAARARQVRIDIGGDAAATFDRDRIGQVFVNLLDNAVRHAREGGTVTVRFAAAKAEVIARVTDDGDGFAPDVERRLGAPFALGPGGRVGLGLAISRTLVEAHGGALRVGRSRSGGAEVVIALRR